MAGSSWKVAYADFMTAMMAFFLVIWLLNMASEDTLKDLAGYFRADAQYSSNVTSLYTVSNNPLVQYVDKLDAREFKMSETEESHYAIAQSLKQFLLKDALSSTSSGITFDGVGVLLHITSNLMFKLGTAELSEEGAKVM